MAYRFDGANDVVKFAAGAIADGSYGRHGAYTALALVKRNATGVWHSILGVDVGAGGVVRNELEINPSNQLAIWAGNSAASSWHSAFTLTSTSAWHVVGVSWGGNLTTPTFHLWDGTTWTHSAGVVDGAPDLLNPRTFLGTDLIVVGETNGNDDLAADVQIVGYRKALLTNTEVEAAVSMTLRDTWDAAGFDWLAEFGDSTARQDRSAGGTGDETTRVGTTLVADPPGWTGDPHPDVVFSRPVLQAGTAPASAASAWGFGSWVSLLAAGWPFDVAVYSVQFQVQEVVAADDTLREIVLELGTGASGAEATAAQIPYSFKPDTRVGYYLDVQERVVLAEPILVPAGTPLSVRVADSSTSAVTYGSVEVVFREIADAGTTVVGVTLAAVADVRAIRNRTLAALADVRAVRSRETAFLADVRAVRGRTLAAPYDLRAAVGRTFSGVYDLLGLAVVGRTLSAVYDLRATRGQTKAFPSDLRAATGRTTAFVADVRAATGRTTAFVYDLRAIRARTLAAVADVRAVTGRTTAFVYDLRAVRSRTTAFVYDLNVVGAIGATLSAVYDLRALRARTLAAPADVRATRSREAAFVADVRATRSRTLSAVADVLALRGRTLSAVYDLVATVGRTLTGRYDVAGTAGVPGDVVASVELRENVTVEIERLEGVSSEISAADVTVTLSGS